MPMMYIISGCNGSGKTTASYSMLPGILDVREFVNSDEFAKSFSPFSPGVASVTASRYMLRKMDYLFSRRADFCLETTLATRSLLKVISGAREQGYFVTVTYLWLSSADLAVQRVAARVATGGHDIPEATIRRRYAVGLYYFFNDYVQAADQWRLIDNSDLDYRTVAEGSRRGMKVADMETYLKIRSIALAPPEVPAGGIARPPAASVPAPNAHDGIPATTDK